VLHVLRSFNVSRENSFESLSIFSNSSENRNAVRNVVGPFKRERANKAGTTRKVVAATSRNDAANVLVEILDEIAADAGDGARHFNIRTVTIAGRAGMSVGLGPKDCEMSLPMSKSLTEPTDFRKAAENCVKVPATGAGLDLRDGDVSHILKFRTEKSTKLFPTREGFIIILHVIGEGGREEIRRAGFAVPRRKPAHHALGAERGASFTDGWARALRAALIGHGVAVYFHHFSYRPGPDNPDLTGELGTLLPHRQEGGSAADTPPYLVHVNGLLGCRLHELST